MDIKSLFLGENAISKVAGIVDDEVAAQAAATALEQQMQLRREQVEVLGPARGPELAAEAFSRRLEPATGGPGHLALRAQMTVGMLGLAAGLLAWVVSQSMAVAFSSASVPGLLVSAAVGGVLGLVIASLMRFRPDQSLVVDRVRHALKNGRWAVVVHPRNASQLDQASLQLRSLQADVIRSL